MCEGRGGLWIDVLAQELGVDCTPSCAVRYGIKVW